MEFEDSLKRNADEIKDIEMGNAELNRNYEEKEENK